MANAENEHYAKTLERSAQGKDSVFEIGEITSFDSKKMTASVLGLRTKEVKEDVIVTFPNLFMNSGIILFPLNKTKGLLYVGPDNQNYFLPAQFHLPNMDTDEQSGKASLDASPERVDPLINFSDFEQGEYLFRHITGSQLVFRNNGSIEMSSNKSHNMTIDSVNGELQKTFDSIDTKIGYSHFENKVIQPKDSNGESMHMIKFSLKETGPEWHSIVPISLPDAIKNLKEGVNLDMPIIKDIMKLELVNVLDEDGNTVLSQEDQSELFMNLELDFNEVKYQKQISKNGTFTETLQSDSSKNKKVSLPNKNVYEITNQDGTKLTIESSSKGFDLKLIGNGASKVINLNSSTISLKNGSSDLTVSQGDISFKTSAGSTSINDIINHMKG